MTRWNKDAGVGDGVRASVVLPTPAKIAIANAAKVQFRRIEVKLMIFYYKRQKAPEQKAEGFSPIPLMIYISQQIYLNCCE